MNRTVRKLFSLLLLALLCCSMMPAYAAEGPVWDVSASDEVSASAVPNADTIDVPIGTAEGMGLNILVSGSTYAKRGYYVGWNRTATLKVKAETTSGSVEKYQWYSVPYNKISNSGDSVSFPASYAVSGAAKSSYKPPVYLQDTPQYYVCVATDSNGDSAAAVFQFLPGISRGYIHLGNDPKGVRLSQIYAFSIGGGTEYFDGEDYYYDVHHVNEWLSTATKYEISRKEQGGKWKVLKTITGKGPQGPKMDWSDQYDFYESYTDTTVKMGVRYAYRYRSYSNDAWLPSSSNDVITFNPFKDVSLEEERAQYIAWAYNNSVVKGDGKGYFNPDAPCTRMNFVMILWKMHGKPTVSGSNPFSDVSGSTSVNAVKWAVKKKLVTGTGATTFSPDDNLSRINIIMILYKLAGSPKASAESRYEDITGSKTTKAVNWAVGKGLISPVDETHFAPDDNCSRALLVEILCKYNEIYKIL